MARFYKCNDTNLFQNFAKVVLNPTVKPNESENLGYVKWIGACRKQKDVKIAK